MTNTSTNTPRPQYRGRFAPSPTGALHFGSLIAAVGSYLQARHHHGQWWVRIEDLDPPREVAGSADLILRTLDGCGLHWDGEICYQSKRSNAYLEALERLHTAGVLYPCHCSRKQIAETIANRGSPTSVYPGTCRTQAYTSRHGHALRVNTEAQQISFRDIIQGDYRSILDHDSGDFVVQRADGLFAYQLAVVVDDAEQGMTEIVRGSDLLDSTPGQIYLQQQLGLTTPDYLHLPIVTNEAGEKLSKQTFARPLGLTDPLPDLWQALDFLGQKPPMALKNASLDEFWQWAHQHWTIEMIPRTMTQIAPCTPLCLL